MRKFLSAAILLLASPLFAQDLTIKGDTKIVQVDKIVVTHEDRLLVQSLPFTVSAAPGAFDYRWSFPSNVTALDMGDTLKVTAAPKGECTIGVNVKTIDFDAKKVTSKFQSLTFLIGEVTPPAPPVPPTPPVPPVPPPPPAPVPVKSFRVIFIYESSKTLPAAQTSTMYAKTVRDWLLANTTPEGGWAGYRYYDKDTDAAKESPTMKSLWDAVHPKITTVPCVAVEVNGVVEIIPLAANPAEMVSILQKYKGGL